MEQSSPTFNEANDAYQQGDFGRAEQLCQQLTQSNPHEAGVWHLCAMIAHRQANSELAARRMEHAVQLAPGNAEYRTHAAEIFRRSARLEDAVTSAREAVRLAPQHPATHNNMGLALQDMENLGEAEACFRQAIAADPHYHRAHHNLGNILILRGRLREAHQVLSEALRLQPDSPQALNGLGLALQRQHRYGEALDALAKATKLRADYPQAQLNLGNTLAELGRLEEAERCLRQLLRVHPHYVKAWHDLGALWEKRKQLGEACNAYRKAVCLDPDSVRTLAALENAKRRSCDWSDRPQCIEQLLSIVREFIARQAASPLWPLASLRFPTTSAERLAIATQYARTISASVSATECSRSSPVRSPPSATTSTRLRIGFLSHEFGHTVVSHLTAGLYRRFDRGRFEIVGLDYSRDDGSQLREGVIRDCDRFVQLSRLTPAAAAERIAAEGIDILLDINSYMPGGRPEIAAHRPASIQVSYMYPASMGADWIDYFLTDRFVTPPGHERFFAEKLVYLPEPYLPTNCDQVISDSSPGRTAHGLPEEGFVFCSFNNADKIEPELFDIWMDILHQLPGSVLWQRCDEQIVKENLVSEARERDIDPQRLIFAEQLSNSGDHLARQRHANLFLDTLTHGGHGTAVDALWAGVPVLVCPGEVFTSRVAASLLTAAGLPELIAKDLDEYRQRAIRLAQNPDELQRLRGKLAVARTASPVFDTPRLVRNLQSVFWEMWLKYRSGQPPEKIVVDDTCPDLE